MRSIRNLMLTASCLMAACTTIPEGLKKFTTTIDDAQLIAKTENLVCRGEAVMPFDNEKLGLTLGFEKPDGEGARGITQFSKGQDGIFRECRLGKSKMSLICGAAAGPVVIPMMLQFSSDMGQAAGWFGSPFRSDADIHFKTDCSYVAPG